MTPPCVDQRHDRIADVRRKVGPSARDVQDRRWTFAVLTINVIRRRQGHSARKDAVQRGTPRKSRNRKAVLPVAAKSNAGSIPAAPSWSKHTSLVGNEDSKWPTSQRLSFCGWSCAEFITMIEFGIVVSTTTPYSIDGVNLKLSFRMSATKMGKTS